MGYLENGTGGCHSQTYNNSLPHGNVAATGVGSQRRRPYETLDEAVLEVVACATGARGGN